MTTLLLALAGAGAVLVLGYLAACASAQRWLTLREWLARTTCSHAHGVLVAIEFDGEAVYRCTGCGKHIGKPL